jgi:cell wall-associated NlpC family hydrolase
MKKYIIVLFVVFVACSTSKNVSNKKERSKNQKVAVSKSNNKSSNSSQKNSNISTSKIVNKEEQSNKQKNRTNTVTEIGLRTCTKIEKIKELPKDSILLIKSQLIMNSEKFLGTPYRSGGETPRGFDCSGFAKYVYRTVGIDIPRTSGDQAKLGKEVDLKKADAGDLIFFGQKKGKKIVFTHTAIIYANDNGKISMIHSASNGIVIDEVGSYGWNSYYKDRLLFVKRIL